MKKTIKLLCTWAAGLLLAGCSSEADMEKLMDWQSNPDAVHFTASVNNATTRTNPAATDATQTNFNKNDQVTVSNNGNQADYAYNGTSWVPAEAGKYLLWDRSNLTFNCWYPAGGNNTATVGYLTADQSSAELMAKSDYMNATTVLQTANDPLNFNLVRKTARLILKISGFTDVPGNIKHVRIVSKASTAEGETNTIDITPLAQKGEGEIGGIGTTYTALVAPGEVVAKLYFTDDMSDTKPLTMTTNVTAAGSSYIYNLTVSKEKIKVTGVTAGAWVQGTGIVDNLTSIPYVTFTADAIQELMMPLDNISNLQYSVNFGEWRDAKSDDGLPWWSVLFGGEKGCLRLRCKRNFHGTAYGDENYTQIFFSNSVKVACTGDIRTLLDYENYETVKTSGAQFCSLFEGCKQLTSAPDLPATELYDYCYNSMFKGCISLEKAPDLPATTLKQSCYNEMFQGCTSLKEVPVLQAKEMAPSAYRSMFRGCTSLVTAPTLPATTTAENCYQNMFYGCTSLKNVQLQLPAKIMKESCYTNMFYGCTSLENAPKLPATTLDKYCYWCMFQGCTSLKTAPDLPATKMVEFCYSTMFYGCTSLVKAPALDATILARNCCSSMFYGCTSLEKAPDLNATTLDTNCYSSMFYGCKKLSSVKMLALSETIFKDNIKNWLDGAGTSATTGRTLIVKDQTAYDALKTNNLLPADYWQKGKCTVKAADGTDIK